MLVLRVFACLFLLLIVSPVSGQENGRPALPDNLHVITAANANRLEEVARLGTGSVDNLIWSPNNRYVAAFGASGVWLFKSDDISEPILHLQNHSESVEYAVFSPDSSLIATGGEDVVIVTIVATGETLHTLEAAMGFAAFTPDGLWLVTDSHLEYDSPIVWSV
ncbi:MAG: hypothetical protein KC519_14220, partial [Anaerolineae bacterium]|nr:hypothetical protein [Anaerolineae bacterium]